MNILMSSYYDLLYALFKKNIGKSLPVDYEEHLDEAKADPRFLVEKLMPEPDLFKISGDPCWKIHEACAYAVWLRPEIIDASVMEAYQSKSWHAETWLLLTRYAERAQWIGDLSEFVRPPEFLKWANKQQLSLAEGFLDLFSASAWCDEDGNPLHGPLIPLEKAEPHKPVARHERELRTQERRTLLTIIHAMATGKYGWKSGARSEVPGVIASRVAVSGGSLSSETIRLKLQEADQLIAGADD